MLSLCAPSPRPVVIQILFSSESPGETSTRPVKCGGDEIMGCLQAWTTADGLLEVDLAFEGYVRTWIPGNESIPFSTGPPSAAQIKTDDGRVRRGPAAKQILEQIQTLSTDDDGSSRNDALRLVTLPFRFVLPRQLIAAQDDVAPSFLDLCPSAQIGRIYTDPAEGIRYGQPVISYAVRVHQLRHIRPGDPCGPPALPAACAFVAHAREVVVRPATPPAPPTALSDFGGDYIVHDRARLYGAWRHRCLGMLAVHSAEPAPMPTGRHDAVPVPRCCTSINLELVFTPSSSSGGTPPPAWTLAVTYAVRSRTFFSTRPLERVPTRQAAKCHRAFLRCTDGQERPQTREYHIPVAQWTHRHASHGDTATAALPSGPWTTTLPVCVSTSQPLLVPTFLNRLSTRQYAILVRLHIKGVRHRAPQLVLPLQVVWQVV